MSDELHAADCEIERVRQSFKAELVPYKSTTDLIRADDVRPQRRTIRVEREGPRGPTRP